MKVLHSFVRTNNVNLGGLWNNRGSSVFRVNDLFNSRRYVKVYDHPTVFQTAMSRRDVRYYKFTPQVPLGNDATFQHSQRKRERPDVDFSNGWVSLDFNLEGDINFNSGNLSFAYLYKN